jgi:hypothetical protein
MTNEDLEEILYLENLESLSLQYFGKSTYQTILFVYMEIKFTMVGSPDYLIPEKAIRKYLSWQSCSNPKNALLKRWKKYTFNHEDDLTWNDCLKFDTKYRREVEQSYQPVLITFAELEDDEVYKETIENNSNYTKVERGYIRNK